MIGEPPPVLSVTKGSPRAAKKIPLSARPEPVEGYEWIKRQKKVPGFTLVEVLITTVIIGLLLIPIFANQTTIVRAVSRSSHALSRIFQAKKFLLIKNFH